MCKLCNTDKPSAIISSKIASQQALLFHSIVFEYIGENCCIACSKAFSDYICRTAKQDIVTEADMFIPQRLWKYHYLANPKLKEELQVHNRKIQQKRSANNYKKNRVRTSKFGIEINFNTITKHTSYMPYMRKDKKSYCLPIYSTFEEALMAKIQHMQENDMLQGLSRLTKKLKELQHESN